MLRALARLLWLMGLLFLLLTGVCVVRYASLMTEPLISNEDWARIGAMGHFYCPLCGCREELGSRCICGLLWTEERREMPHYARLLTGLEAEKLRHALSRRKTRSAVEECKLYNKRQGPRLFCASEAVRRFWRDPD